MDIAEVLALFDRDQRREITFPDMERQVLPGIVRFLRPRPGMSFILYSDLDEATADATIDAQLAYFEKNNLKMEWKVFGHDRPADLAQRLIARGFAPEEEDAIMVLDVASAPASLLAEPAVDVRRLTDPAQLADVVTVLEAVWAEKFNWVYERLGRHMAIPGYLSIYVAYVDEQPAAVAWTYFNAGSFAGLWGGSTLSPYRRRGLYTALLAARVREARARGVPYLTVDAGSMSRPIVERHGFQLLTTSVSCEWPAGGA